MIQQKDTKGPQVLVRFVGNLSFLFCEVVVNLRRQNATPHFFGWNCELGRNTPPWKWNLKKTIEKGKSSSIHLHSWIPCEKIRGFLAEIENTNCKSAIQLIGRSKQGICTEKFEQCQWTHGCYRYAFGALGWSCKINSDMKRWWELSLTQRRRFCKFLAFDVL